MLENPSLWFSPPTPTGPPGLSPTGRLLRRVLAPDRHEPVGYVAITPGRWLPWPTRLRLAVYEEPDASLLFTAKRIGWLWPATAVAEADGIVVALVYEGSVASSTSQFLARRRIDPRGRGGVFVNAAGVELVRWQRDNGGLTVAFAAGVNSQPYLVMGLLAAVLVGA
jgi:hypothetical protein